MLTRILTTTCLCVLTLFVSPARAAETSAENAEFFESKIRPLLAENCYQCHSAKAPTVFAGLRLDSRDGLLHGGDSGPAIVPGEPGKSTLIQRVQGKPVLMPPSGRLRDEDVTALVKWVELGAPWAADAGAGQPAPTAAFNLQERKQSHWAWQPVRKVEPPVVRKADWSKQPLDNFILAKLEASHLAPAAAADRNTLIRRLSFDLRGLPPSPDEVSAFVGDQSPDAYKNLVDRFLASPQYGERWARHWMDLFRYSESHGSEGDPRVPQAWRYRDYLIRALNQDVPYDQLIREHLAGDLLANPRIDQTDQVNESVLGTAHFRMVEHAYQPVDAWEDRVKCIDNQVDVVSKAFEGLTVSCARCHDHKFDAISQKDYYSLFGILYGARPTQRAIDSPQLLNTGREKMTALKSQIRDALAQVWLEQADTLGRQLRETLAQTTRNAKLENILEQASCDYGSPLEPWIKLSRKQGSDFTAGWSERTAFWKAELESHKTFNNENFKILWDLSGPDYKQWISHGTGVAPDPSRPGEFRIQVEGDRVLDGIYPAGAYTHLLSTKHAGVIQSPRFKIDSDYVSVEVLGNDMSFAQLIVENYAVPGGGIYDMRSAPESDEMGWARWSTAYWKGFTAYVEFATRDDVTRFEYPAGDETHRPKGRKDGRSYIGAGRVVVHDKPLTPQLGVLPVLSLLDRAPGSPGQLADQLSARLRESIVAWKDGKLDAQQEAFLDYFLRRDLLPRSLDQLEALRPLVSDYRDVEKTVPVPRRAPGVLDEHSPDQPLLVRGNHKSPGDIVPRHFLSALKEAPYGDPSSVRLKLAEDIANPDNPLTSRVIANRLWTYLFGNGIVRTPDNFGKLGETPTHPELLDYLAAKFVEDGWSIKRMIRLLVTSQAYQMSSHASEESAKSDPANKLLQHANVRRLDAEAIRDEILAVSGRMDSNLYGESISVYHGFSAATIEGGGHQGPIDGAGRRSVYQEIRRDKQNPFLEVFDMPMPTTTRGQRDITNGPAQSLAMLNSPFVIGQAEEWGRRLATGEAHSVDSRIDYVFLKTLSRAPSASERTQAAHYLASLAAEHKIQASEMLGSSVIWQDFAHAMFNLKEFIYVF